MALALKRVRGQDIGTTGLVLTGAGTILAWSNFSLDVKQGSTDATASASKFEQKVLMRRSATGSVDVFLGTEGVPPNVGDDITVIAVKVGLDFITPADIADATVFGKYKVTGVNYKVADGPGTATISFESGFLD